MERPEPALPAGAPESVTFDGILDGRVGDEEGLRQRAAELGRCGGGRFLLEVDGGRFSLLPEGDTVPGAGFAEPGQQAFLQALTALLGAAAERSVESTLRCTMVYRAQVVETLFRVADGRVAPLSRVRPRRPDEGAPELPAGLAERHGFGRRELLIAVLLLVVGGAWVTWRYGLLDRVMAARAESLQVEAGPFGRLLRVEVSRSWGVYRISVLRGEAYPADAAALQAAQAAAAGLPERAAVEVVGNGGEMWVQIQDGEGRVLEAARIELRPLVVDPAGKVGLDLGGRMDAARIALSLTRGETPKGR